MSDIQILPCNFDDPVHTNAVVSLMNAYITDSMGGGETYSNQRAHALVEGLKNFPTSIVLLASVNNRFVGLCNAFVTLATFTVKKAINVHDLIVLKEFRGIGAGRKLMQEIIKIANETDCSKVTLEVRDDNGPAQKLYNSLGFADCQPKMHFWVKML
jgi:ribosomal protein S18 acetylase RimI-like enzyme